MSKESLRKKIEEAKEKTKKAMTAKGVSAEMVIAVESLLLIIDIIVALFLEKKTRKNSSNSGLPPSRNEGPNGNRNKNIVRGDKLGAQIGHTRNISTQEVLTPQSCSNCQKDLGAVKATAQEDRRLIDIVYEVVTHTVTVETKECPDCGHINKGKFPAGMDGEVQYGNGIKTMIINFLVVQMMSLERAQEYFNGIIGRFISQAVMLKYIAQLSLSLESWEKRQIEKLMTAPAIVRAPQEGNWCH